MYPERPLVGVGGIVARRGEVLIVKRKSEPSYGRWSIPGGLVNLGETVAEACAREVEEETGIIVEVGEVVDVCDYIERDSEGRVRFHYVIIDFLAAPVGGSLRAGDDALDARFVNTSELENYDLTVTTRRVFAKLGWLKESRI
ncbi:MAG: NUDIX hydrolase [Candidatus Freyarchaeota archaeon]|nr:NUDIX hydrolase [Candidatus Jordarchaeia archaeon]